MMAVAAARSIARSASSGRLGVSYRARRSSAECHSALNISVAVSGYSKVGMPAWRRMAAPSATPRPPIHEASTGLPAMWA